MAVQERKKILQSSGHMLSSRRVTKSCSISFKIALIKTEQTVLTACQCKEEARPGHWASQEERSLV